MITLVTIWVFILGLIFGSFLNVLLWRLPEGKGIGGRSKCRSCHHTLAWYDLIPILSFIYLRGKCRYCDTPIHIRYPVVELATALSLVLFMIFRQPALNADSIITAFIIVVLVSLVFFDFLYFILPDVLILPAATIYLAYDIMRVPNVASYIITGLLLAAFFAIIYAVSKGRSLGFGDVKLALLIGLVLGYPLGFIAVIGGIWLASIVALLLMFLKRVGPKDAIPLGSFLALSTIICIIFYNEVLPIAALFK